MRYAILLVLIGGCVAPPAGYRTSSGLEAVFATAQAVCTYPEMVVPRDDKTQAEMEAAADLQRGPEVVPEGILGPDAFLPGNTSASPAVYAGVAAQNYWYPRPRIWF